MIAREKFINKLRELGYSYSRDCDRTTMWRRGTHRVFVRKTAAVREAWVRATLQQCGLDSEAIEVFIRSASC